MNHITEPERKTEILCEADVVVLGGRLKASPASCAGTWSAGAK